MPEELTKAFKLNGWPFLNTVASMFIAGMAALYTQGQDTQDEKIERLEKQVNKIDDSVSMKLERISDNVQEIKLSIVRLEK